MNPVFVETSALLQYLFQEPNHFVVSKKLNSSKKWIASRLLKIESERALLRLAIERPQHEKHIPEIKFALRAIFSKIDFIEMTREIAEQASKVAPHHRLRTLDAIHLATYYKIKEVLPELQIITFDKRILESLSV